MPQTTYRAAIYARVSTVEQNCDNQLLELRKYVEARGWTAQEYVDRGVNGSKDKRPALDALLKDAKRRRFDVLVCWRLDRLGRNLRHLVTMLEELQHIGVAFVSMGEGIDCTTPAGKLQLHILAALAEFERERIRERVMASLHRARAQGKRLGRPREVVQQLSSFLAATSGPLRGHGACPRRRRRGGLPRDVRQPPPQAPHTFDVSTSRNSYGI